MDRAGTGLTDGFPARWWHSEGDNRVRCDLCPHSCLLSEERSGRCGVRENRNGSLVSIAYGAASGFSIDPVEKKPLYHFLPGSPTFSFGTIGCNLSCRFCQNWHISQTRDRTRLTEHSTPAEIATLAGSRCQSVSFTYNEPAVFGEFALDTAEVVHSLGMKTIAVSAGFFQPAAAREFFGQMDASNIDLKAFSEDFYRDYCGANLAPVLETLRTIRHETSCHLEITTLLIPEANDSDEEITALCRWVCRELGPDVPVHFSAFHPDHLLIDRDPTPPSTVHRARKIAMAEGLKFVYSGNIRDPEGSTTFCPQCRNKLVAREGFRVLTNRLVENGSCPDCGATVPGFWC